MESVAPGLVPEHPKIGTPAACGKSRVRPPFGLRAVQEQGLRQGCHPSALSSVNRKRRPIGVESAAKRVITTTAENRFSTMGEGG